MATCSILRTGVDAGISGILPTVRSPKNAWISDFDSFDVRQRSNNFASRRTPSANGIVVEACTASIAASGAGLPARLLASLIARGIEYRRIRSGQLFTAFTGSRYRGATDFSREKPARLPEDPPRLSCRLNDPRCLLRALLSLSRFAPNAHISTALAIPAKRGRRLCSARSGNQSDFHFRLSDLRRRGHDAIVRGHRGLQPSTERRAVQRRDNGLRTILHDL